MNKKICAGCITTAGAAHSKHYSFTKTISNIYDSISFFLVSLLLELLRLFFYLK